MAGIIIAFAVGIIMTAAVIRIACTKLTHQRNSYEMMLKESRARIDRYSLEEAYRNGRNDEYEARKEETVFLQQRNLRLVEENEKLRDQINTESIFSNTIAQQGRAAILLRKDR